MGRIAVPAPAACSCGTSLVEAPITAVRRRQVHDLPQIPEPVVTEYAAEVIPEGARCVKGVGDRGPGFFASQADMPR